AQRGHGHDLVRLECGHPGHAGQPRLAVDLHGTGAALAGLAVPPAGQVRGLGRLEAMDHIQDHLAIGHVHLVVPQRAVVDVATPDPEGPTPHARAPRGCRRLPPETGTWPVRYGRTERPAPGASARSPGAPGVPHPRR